VFGNRVLRRMFGTEREEIARGWRQLFNEGIRNLYRLPYFIRMIGSRRMEWAGHVERVGDKNNACRILVGKREERDT
jgi:hypothetical protein